MQVTSMGNFRRYPPLKADMYMDDDYDGEEWYSDDEENLAAERELAEDAQWKMIQKNTFTRWCNEHLKPVNKVHLSCQR